jgi:hypothetical protein
MFGNGTSFICFLYYTIHSSLDEEALNESEDTYSGQDIVEVNLMLAFNSHDDEHK